MLPEPIRAHLACHHGLLATWQLRQLEPDADRRRSILRHADLEPLTSRVRRHVAAPDSELQALAAAAYDLGPNGVVWGKTAARFWGFGPYRARPIHVATTRRRLRAPHLGQVHIVRSMLPSEITVHDAVPIARPEVVILWLTGVWTHRLASPEAAALRVRPLLDRAWSRGLISGPYIHELCARSGGRGRSGIVALRLLLEERPVDYQPTGSGLESRFEDLVPADLRGRLRRQVRTGSEVALIGVVDFMVIDRPLIIEINGEAFHTSLTDRAADNARYEALVAAGFTVVVYWEHDVWYEPWTVTRTLAAIARRPLVPELIRPTPAPWENDPARYGAPSVNW